MTSAAASRFSALRAAQAGPERTKSHPAIHASQAGPERTKSHPAIHASQAGPERTKSHPATHAAQAGPERTKSPPAIHAAQAGPERTKSHPAIHAAQAGPERTKSHPAIPPALTERHTTLTLVFLMKVNEQAVSSSSCVCTDTSDTKRRVLASVLMCLYSHLGHQAASSSRCDVRAGCLGRSCWDRWMTISLPGGWGLALTPWCGATF